MWQFRQSLNLLSLLYRVTSTYIRVNTIGIPIITLRLPLVKRWRRSRWSSASSMDTWYFTNQSANSIIKRGTVKKECLNHSWSRREVTPYVCFHWWAAFFYLQERSPNTSTILVILELYVSYLYILDKDALYPFFQALFLF